MTAALPPAQYLDLLRRRPGFKIPGPPRCIEITPALMAAFGDLFERVERTTLYRKEAKDVWGWVQKVQTLFGRWVYVGDCDEFVFRYQGVLTRAGVPKGAIRIITCRLADGRGHLVLGVTGTKGTLIFGNRQGGPIWQHHIDNYTWVARSVPGAWFWESLAHLNKKKGARKRPF